MKCKSIKILLSFLLCALLIPVFPVSAFEDENLLSTVSEPTKHYQVSEYGAIMQKLTDYKRSKTKGISSFNSQDDELLEIMKERKEYQDYIYKLKELSETELIDLNFDNNQINAIKNFDGSDEMATRASATISATLKLTKFNYTASDNRTHASATFSGSWKGTPFFRQQDTIGIGMIGSLSRFVKKSSSNAITHYDGSVVRNTYGEYKSSAGQTYKFGIGSDPAHVFKKFTMTYTADADGKNTLMDYGAAYAHFKGTIPSVGLSIGVSGKNANIGISFNIDADGKDHGEIEWKKILPRSTYI